MVGNRSPSRFSVSKDNSAGGDEHIPAVRNTPVTDFVSTETGLAATSRFYLGRAVVGEVFLLTAPFIERLRREGTEKAL